MRNGAAGWLPAMLAAGAFSAQAADLLDDRMEARGSHIPSWFAETQDVELDGDIACSFGVGGLAVYDIDMPDEPVFLGRYEPPGHPWNRFYRGAVGSGVAYAGGRDYAISIIDISDETNPGLILVYGTHGISYEGLALDGDLLVAARHGDGLELIDVSNPADPTTLSELGGLTDAWDLEIHNGIAYVADGAGGLRLVDVSDPQQPLIVATQATSGSAKDVDVEDGVAVVACGSAGVDVFDVGDPGSPQLLGHGNTSGLAITVDVDGDRAFVADWDDVEVLDLSTPQSPGFAGWEKPPVRSMGLAARDGFVYVADWNAFRSYKHGPTSTPDVHVFVEDITFLDWQPGVPRDTTFAIANTGAATLSVQEVQSLSPLFVIQEPVSFTVPGHSEHTVTVTYTPSGGDDSTFLTVLSDDADEPGVNVRMHAGDSENTLDIGEMAPEWTLYDLDGIEYSLSDYLGQVVLMAFMADW